MSVTRGLVIIVACGMGFGAAGGLLGLALGVGAPAYYRGVFGRGNEPSFSPVQVGLGLGTTQGLIIGVAVGAVVVIAGSMENRFIHKADLDEIAVGRADRDRPRPSWIRRVLALLVVLAATGAGGAVGFVIGAVVGQVELYGLIAEAKAAKVRPVLGELKLTGIRIEPSSVGDIFLWGQVGSPRARAALEGRMRCLFGEDQARSMMQGVEVVGE